MPSEPHQRGLGVGIVATLGAFRLILPHGPVLAMPLMPMHVPPGLFGQVHLDQVQDVNPRHSFGLKLENLHPATCKSGRSMPHR